MWSTDAGATVKTTTRRPSGAATWPEGFQLPQLDPDLPSSVMHPQPPDQPWQGLLAALRSTLPGLARWLLRRVRMKGGRDLPGKRGSGRITNKARAVGPAGVYAGRCPDPAESGHSGSGVVNQAIGV